MTKRERKARQRANRRQRRFISWCRRINQNGIRKMLQAEVDAEIDKALAENAPGVGRSQ